MGGHRISSKLRVDEQRSQEQEEAMQALRQLPRRSSPVASSASKGPSKGDTGESKTPAQPLASRYSYDVGSASEVAKLNTIAEKHRAELEAENSDLRTKFSRDTHNVR